MAPLDAYVVSLRTLLNEQETKFSKKPEDAEQERKFVQVLVLNPV